MFTQVRVIKQAFLVFKTLRKNMVCTVPGSLILTLLPVMVSITEVPGVYFEWFPGRV